MLTRKALRNLEEGSAMKHILIIVLAVSVLGLVAAYPALADLCQDCHSSSIFKVKHKALYDHHVGYETSVHGLAGLSCVDCHGGDPNAEDKDVAHAGVREQVKDPAIPATCGECHEEQYEAFSGSEHYAATKDERETMNCVVCRGSMDMDVTCVSKVYRKCMRCHDRSDDPASIDVMTSDLLDKIIAIMGYRAKIQFATVDQATIVDIETTFEQMVQQWHCLDLAGASATAEELLNELRQANGSAVSETGDGGQ